METMEKLFENATRGKYRFSFKGSITVEDLWDLSPQNLDTIYKSLTKELKQSQEESLLVKKTEVDAVLDDKINLVKYIVLTKLKEEDQRNKEREFKEKKQKILGLIADKQDNELQSKSIDELKDMLESLK
mgnify:FL=1